MGLENRDYARDENRSRRDFGGVTNDWPTVCKYIIYANVIVFIAQIFSVRKITLDEFLQRYIQPSKLEKVVSEIEQVSGKQITELSQTEKREILRGFGGIPSVSSVQMMLEIDTRKIMKGQVWRLFTGAFCHDRLNAMHILFNMLFVFWFGLTLERIYGSREFFLFYFAAVLTSSIAYVCLDLWLQDFLPAIGASGAVMAITMLYAIHFPRHTILLFFVIPVEIKWLIVIYLAYDLYPVLLSLSGKDVNTGVAHAGHLGGLAFGFLYWRFQLQLSRFLPGSGASQSRLSSGRRPLIPIGKRREQPSMDDDVKHDDRDDFDRQIDELLRKIKLEGEENLSDDERKLLEKASRWYRDRGSL